MNQADSYIVPFEKHQLVASRWQHIWEFNGVIMRNKVGIRYCLQAMTKNTQRFTHHLWLSMALAVILIGAFALYAWSEKQIDRANDLRHHSFLLADELRQSSDDLTRMARTYVVTGDARYKAAYQAVLAIRDGTKPRPAGYQNVYWDTVLANGGLPPDDRGQAVALLTLMQQAGFSPQELEKLTLAKANSDRLTTTETTAMQLIETSDAQAPANHVQARLMLHDEAYHLAKAAIMQPIKEFEELLDQRTREAVVRAQTQALVLRLIFIVVALGLLTMVLRTRRMLRATLGGSMDQVFAEISSIGQSDLAAPLAATRHDQNNVLGWLAQTQTRLKAIEIERNLAQRREQLRVQTLELLAGDAPLTQVLETLVLSVQDINPDAICSILLLDETRQRLAHGVAPGLPEFFVSAVEGLEIGLGVGSCGTAAFTGERVLVEDIQTHPYWASYRALADKAGLGACWSQPILASSGQVLGTFAVYHRKPQLPDADEVRLIEQSAHLASIAIEKTRAVQELKASEAHFRGIFEHAADAILLIGLDGFVRDANPAACRVYGYAHSEFIGLHGSKFVNPAHAENFSTALAAIKAGQSCAVESVDVRKDGTPFPVEVHISPFTHRGEAVMLCAVNDVTERKKMADQVRQMAFYDPLTGLPNRRLLNDRLSQTMAASKRSALFGALMYLDLDNFKRLNDRHGHGVGDLLLIEVARRLGECVREADTVARQGGDEFVVILAELDADRARAQEQAGAVAEKVRASLAQPFVLNTSNAGQPDSLVTHHCSASIGVAVFVAHEVSQVDLLRRADAAMYQAKEAGRNAIRFVEVLPDEAGEYGANPSAPMVANGSSDAPVWHHPPIRS